MPTTNSQESSARELTDASLHVERENADREMMANRTAKERDADAVIEHARENADAILLAAREKADQKVNDVTPREVQTAIAVDREIEDEALRDERAVADKLVHSERTASTRMIKRLLPLERDATDQYLLTERARSDDALATRDDFLGMVSHDLRDLLNGVVMSSQFLAQKLERHEDSERLLVETTRIERYGARMNRLIGDLVDVASIDAGKLSMQSVEGDVSSLVVEAIDALQASASAKGVSLTVQAIQRPCQATFDHDRLLQVLANLVANSIKFTPRGGNIRVHFESVGEAIEFVVEDSGIGIPAEVLESVFDRFWQVGRNDRRGLGLGLYISRCIVEAHGGNIKAESSPGQGTRMLFNIPVSAKPNL